MQRYILTLRKNNGKIGQYLTVQTDNIYATLMDYSHTDTGLYISSFKQL